MSSINNVTRPCRANNDVSSHSVPSSFRKISRPLTPNLSQGAYFQPVQHLNKNFASSISSAKLLDKNTASSFSRTRSDKDIATSSNSMNKFVNNRYNSSIKGRVNADVDAWKTAVEHSSKPPVSSTLLWTDEELMSIEDSLSGFSTGPEPVGACVMFYILCAVLCVLSVTGTLLFHSSLTTEAALWWLVCVAVGVLLHVLILEPIKAVLIPAYTSIMKKKLY